VSVSSSILSVTVAINRRFFYPPLWVYTRMLFIAVHKWPKEHHIAIGKEMIAGFTALIKKETPKDIILLNTWTREDYGAFCCWNAPNQEELTKLFKQYMPTMLKYTEFVPVLQTYPPTIEYELSLLKMIVDMSK
jgi:hypothetical protein